MGKGMPPRHNPNSDGNRIEIVVLPEWANHIAQVAALVDCRNVTAYVLRAIRNQLDRDGCAFPGEWPEPPNRGKARDLGSSNPRLALRIQPALFNHAAAVAQAFSFGNLSPYIVM